MTNVIVASFDKEDKAIKAMHKLSELESFGDISIYGNAMVRAKENGKYEILREDNHEGWRTLTGMAGGGLLGAIGGPVGFVIGLFAGTTIGLISDVRRQNFNENFLKKIENKMPPGTVSIIAEIDEDSGVFVDNSLKPIGAKIYRSDFDFEFDTYVNEQIEKIDENISKARADLKKSVGNEREKIQKKIAELKEKRKNVIAAARSDVKNFSDQIGDSFRQGRADFIKSRIARYEEKLRQLNEELKEVDNN